MTPTYLYAVIPAEGASTAPGAGLEDLELRFAAHADVAAVVSDAPEQLEGRRRELRRHAEVIEGFLGQGPVLPVRFGTIFDSDDAVVDELLAPRAEELADLLDASRGLVEVRVRAYYDEATVLAEIVAEQPELQTAGRSMAARIQVGEQIVAALQRRRTRDERELVRQLEPRARDVSVGEPSTEMMAADVAFLLDRDELPAFDRAVAELGDAVGERLRLRYVGPLPPASFLELELS